MLYLDTKIFMPTLNLTYNDKMSMASSVEVRVPFLDRELAEFVAWNVKPEWKLKGKWRPVTKHIFREAMRSMLPEEVMRQPKAGFAAPVDYWLAHDLRPMVDDLLSEAQVRRRGLFRPEVVRSYVDEHRRGAEDWSMQIWQLLTLEIWMQLFLDGGAQIVRQQQLCGDSDRRAAQLTICMKQLLQDARTGELKVAEVPAPQLLPGLRAGANRGVAGVGGHGARLRRICPQESAGESEGSSRSRARCDGQDAARWLGFHHANRAFAPGSAAIGRLQQRRSGGCSWRWRLRHQRWRPRCLRRRGICGPRRVCLRAAHAGRRRFPRSREASLREIL